MNTNTYYTRDDAVASIPTTRPYSIIIQHQKPVNDKGITPRIFLVYDSHYDFNNLVNIHQNNYLNEYYPEDKASYFYIDVDKEGQYTPHDKLVILNQILSSTLKQSIKHFQKIFNYLDCSVWDASRPDKLSLHISVPLPFKNKTDLNHFGKLLYNLHPDYIDPNMYNRTAQLRMPYQCKRGNEKFPLLPYQCPVKCQKFKENIFNLISYPEDIKDYCDVSTIEPPTVNKKIVMKTNDILTAEPDYETNNEIEFYLSCIPNHNEGQSYKIWWTIGTILHRYNQSIRLWIDWSNQCSQYGDQTDNCYNFWKTFKQQDDNKGFKIGTLIKLARQYVPKNDIYFNKLYSQVSNLDKTGYEFEKYNEPYVRPYPHDVSVIVEKSPMGTGKTFQIKKYMDTYNPKRCLYLSPRIIFANNIEGEFKDYNFVNYKEDSFNSKCDRVICSIESIHRLNDQVYDLIIMDESETILNTFTSPTLKKIKNCLDSFQTIIKNSGKLICMDAFTSSRTTNFINNIIPPNRKKLLRINEFKPVARIAYELPSGKALIRKIKDKLQQGKKCVVATASNSYCQSVLENLSEFITEHNKTYKFYEANTSDIDKKDVLKCRDAWSNIDLLLYTPTITVGVNFDIPDVFDYLYIYGSDLTTTCRDMFQSSMRIRHIKSNVMFYTFYKSHNHDGFLSKDKIEETLNQRKDLLYQQALEWDNEANKQETKWLKDIVVSSIFERNLSSHFYDMLFKQYLKELNYTHKIISKVKSYDQSKGSKGGYIDIGNYTNKDISKAEYAVKHNKATTEQKLICSNRYMEALINTGLLSEEQKIEFYNSVMTNQITLDKFERLSRCLNGKTPTRVMDNVSEVLNDYSSLYPQINKLVELLGFKSLIDNETVITYDKLNKEKLTKLIDTIQLDMQIRERNGKRNKENKSQSEEVKMINKINQVLSRWCDAEIEKNSEKRKMINGVTHKIRDYKLCINLPLPTTEKPLEDLLIKKMILPKIEVNKKYVMGTPEYIESKKLQHIKAETNANKASFNNTLCDLKEWNRNEPQIMNTIKTLEDRLIKK
jgi:hypothetical protein